MKLDVGIVGGGINGMCIAWQLAQAGHTVTVYEQHTLMSGTSSASSKLLHGGLRYLENREFRLVREALHERNQWLIRAPHLARPLELLLPVYRHSRRSRLAYAAGLKLYDLLATGSTLPGSRWLSTEHIRQQHPSLQSQDLLGAFSFWDAQMDDLALGQWVAQQALQHGAHISEHTQVQRLGSQGQIELSSAAAPARHDRIINAAGPWADQLARASGLSLHHQLDLVRGSHLVLDVPTQQAWLLEVPAERRIFFVLPWKGQTLLGTTEVRHTPGEPVACTPEERRYLLRAYEHHFPQQPYRVVSEFAGLRPLLKSAHDPSKATREYAIEQQACVTTVLGGKWTTAMALARKVCQHIVQPHTTTTA